MAATGATLIPPEKLVEVRRKEAEEERRLLGIGRFFDLGCRRRDR